MKIALLALAVPIILSGCGSSKYPVTFTSDPSFAAVSCNNRAMGYTPLTLYYEREQIKGDTLRLNCVVTWVSGAKEVFENFEIPLSQYPNGAEAWATRENKYPNYHLDAQAAMQGAQQAQQNTRNNQNNDGPTYTTCNRIFGQLHCTSF